MNIWDECEGITQIKSLNITAWRIVELQHKSTTRKLVDTQEEHDILEALLETAKPKYSSHNNFSELHYLLATPFRYPPLKHGSRFGNQFEPSLWYGSRKVSTALAECAYYLFVFFHHTTANFDYIQKYHTAYSVDISTKSSIQLTHPPFLNYKNLISSSSDYEHSQLLGQSMRANGVEAFTFHSSRKNSGINIGMYTPKAFSTKAPNSNFQTWYCYATRNTIDFTRQAVQSIEKHTFDVAFYKIKEKLPMPAA